LKFAKIEKLKHVDVLSTFSSICQIYNI